MPIFVLTYTAHPGNKSRVILHVLMELYSQKPISCNNAGIGSIHPHFYYCMAVRKVIFAKVNCK